MARQKEIIIAVTASIAIYKACEIIRRLKVCGYSTTAVMTKEATQLIRPVVFRSLTGNKVHYDLFEEPDSWQIEHISLAARAGVVLVAPATANIIGKIACGICDDLLTCTICATKAPVILCPAMNNNMYANKAVQRNIRQLKQDGYKFIGPVKGHLADGSLGLGHLADVDKIVKAVKKVL